ncbi:beta strand repeat-containing protein, partial [Ferruginibacter sp. SUN002]|uniref:beta strand repeat-containing protein n=1 Tax=Ferruginibacter sp. SUN002 TaxID=2937789 RepID=UPI003D36C6C7
MFKKLLYACLLPLIATLFAVSASAQTTVFTDDFSGSVTSGTLPTSTSGNTFGLASTSPSAVYTYTNTTNGNNQVRLTSGSLVLGTNGSNQSASQGVTYSYSNLTSPFPSDRKLASSTGLVTWTFNMQKANATNGTYFSTSNGRYIATILCASSASITAAGTTGYMVAQTSTTTYSLYRFANGVTSTTAGDYTLIGTTTGALSATANYASFKVTYNPTDGKWSLYFRDDGASLADPAGGTINQVGTSTVDNTYTSTAMAVFGFYQRKTTSNSDAFLFDNFKITITSSCTPPTPTFTASPTGPQCAPYSATYTTQASMTNYVWSVTGTAGTDYNITSGGIGSGSNTVTLNWLTAGNKTVTVGYTSAGCASTTPASNSLTINTVSTAATNVSATSTSLCSGTNTTTLSQTGGTLGTGASWKWYSDASYTTLVGTGTGSPGTLVLNNLSAASTTYYVRAESSTGSPCTANVGDNTKSVTVTVTTGSSVAGQTLGATSTTICSGTSTTLSQTGGTLASGASWKWYTNSAFTTPVPVNNTGSGLDGTLSVSPTTTTTYYVRAEGGSAPCTAPVGNNAISVTVNVVSAIVLNSYQLSGAGYVVGQTPTDLSVNVIGTGPTYQWYSSPNPDGSDPTLIEVGGDGSTYTPPTDVEGTTYYYCEIYGESPCGMVTSPVSGAITISSASSPTLTLTSGSNVQTVVAGIAIGNIVYTWDGSATAAEVTWSGTASSTTPPTGITVDDNSGAGPVTFSGTPTVSGVYGYSIASTDGVTYSTALTGTLTVRLTVPSPTGATAPTGVGFTANWTEVTGATSYTVKTYLSGVLQTTVSGITAPASSTVITGLTNNTTYTYKVTAVGTPTTLNSDESSASATIRTLSTAKDITSFVIAGVTATIGSNTVTATVPFATNLTSQTPTVAISALAQGYTPSGAQNFSSNVIYTVTAEDGSTKDYTVTITKAAASTAKSITSFVIAGVTATIGSNTITATVPAGNNLAALSPTIAVSALATVSPLSGVSNDFTNDATYTVTAEDGSTQNYTVTISLVLSAPSVTLGGTSATGTSFTARWADVSNESSYTVTVYKTSDNSVVSTLTSIAANSTSTSVTGLTAGTSYYYRVTAVGNGTKYITSAQSANSANISTLSNVATITSFTINGTAGTINDGAGTITVALSTFADRSSLTPTIVLASGATVSPNSGIAQGFCSPVNYTVTAQDGVTTKVYTVTVTVPSPSTSTTINVGSYSTTATLIAAYPVITSITGAYALNNTNGCGTANKITLPNNTASIVTMVFPNGLGTFSGRFAASGNGRIVNIVASGGATGSTTVTFPGSGGSTACLTSTTLTLNSTSSTTIVISTGSGGGNAFLVDATYTIPNAPLSRTSASGTDAQTLQQQSAITNITYSTGSGNPSITWGDGIPSGISTNVSSQVLTISGTLAKFATPKTYPYTIRDGNCATLSGSIVVTAKTYSTDATISSFAFGANSGTIDNLNNTISVSLPDGTDLSALIPTITLGNANATVVPNSGVAQNFNSPVNYTVTAEDEATTKTYTVNVTTALSSEANISAFTISGQISSNISGDNISVTMPYGTNLTALTPSITVSAAATYAPTGAVDFTNPVVFTVTAQDGVTTHDYTVTVVNAVPSISLNSATTLNFNVTGWTASTVQTKTVNAANLINNVSVSVGAPFQVSSTNNGSDWATTATLTQTGGSITNATLYIRYNPTSGTGDNSGTVSLTASGASNSFDVTGKAAPAIALSSGPSTQVVKAGTAITNVVYTITGGVTSATATPLPTGVTFNSGTGTISGTPGTETTYPAVYGYTLTVVGPSGTANATVSDTIIVKDPAAKKMAFLYTSTNAPKGIDKIYTEFEQYFDITTLTAATAAGDTAAQMLDLKNNYDIVYMHEAVGSGTLAYERLGRYIGVMPILNSKGFMYGKTGWPAGSPQNGVTGTDLSVTVNSGFNTHAIFSGATFSGSNVTLATATGQIRWVEGPAAPAGQTQRLIANNRANSPSNAVSILELNTSGANSLSKYMTIALAASPESMSANGLLVMKNAAFYVMTKSITASAGSNGTISPSGEINPTKGSNQTYTITPSSGYKVADVLVDGVSVGAVTSYTFTNITTNHTIAASFVLDCGLYVGTNGDFSNPANWQCGTVPTAGTTITIPSGHGKVTIDADLDITGTLNFSGGAGDTLVIGPGVELKVTGGTVNLNGSPLVLQSTTDGTGSVGAITGGGSITGATNVIAERFTTQQLNRGWRMLALPVASTQTIRASWQENGINDNGFG